VLATELAPVARPDEQAGLLHLPEGEQIYQTLIELHTGLPLSADDLHRIGLEQATETIRAEFAEVGERAFGTTDVRAIYDRPRNDPDPRDKDGEESLRQAARRRGAAPGQRA